MLNESVDKVIIQKDSNDLEDEKKVQEQKNNFIRRDW